MRKAGFGGFLPALFKANQAAQLHRKASHTLL